MAEQNGPLERLYGSARNALSSLIGAGETRLRLLVIELEEERARLVVMLLLSGIAMLLIAFGIGMLMLLIIVAFWESHRLMAIGVSSGVLIVLGLLFAWRVKAIAKRPSFLKSTLQNLGEDRYHLEQRRETS
ncbi:MULTISPECIES: phage holin family protein [Larsenimonas]|uniref:Phage holin family protein n=1 Tax=Larsenimonas suaedae TaxID=1851019 RepID=A0ABU1GXX1_9GAMM|nr:MULTISPECIES: phage holin family protein [Larsenimonas]MCM2972786.1 phage holin family protein [Larsenimonas suaedae]MCM5705736.1 phage holin family protein [Larsenimonas salina]MDR5896885.1 phage holin family protein [Larsenimonas suaedae]